MKALFKTAFLLTLSTALLLSACKQSTEKTTTANKGEKISQEEIKESVEKVVFPLPQPMGVYKMLQEIGASYMGNVLNPYANVENYHMSNVKSVNLGIYAADLSYATVYSKKDDVDVYTKTIKSLVDDLEIKVDYLKLTSEETRAKAQNLDSLIDLTTDIFYDTYEFLYKESEPALAVLMANGFYIEGLYIATHISDETFDNTKMVEIIYGQAEPLDELIKLNAKFADNQYIQTIQAALKKLKEQYDTTDGSLNKEQLQAIKKAVEAIRGTMVS